MKYILFFITFFLNNIAFSQVNIESKRANNKNLLIEAGLNINKGNVKQIEGRINTRIDFKIKKNHKFLALLEYSYGEVNDEMFKNEIFFHSRLTSMVLYNGKLGIEEFIQTQKNEFFNITLRQLIGVGARYQLFHILLFDGYIGLGIMKEWEKIQEDKDNSDIRSTNYLTFLFSNKKKFKLVSTSYFQPLISNPGDFRINAEFAIIFSSSKNLNFKNSIHFIYDSNPPSNIENEQTSIMFFLQYEL